MLQTMLQRSVGSIALLAGHVKQEGREEAGSDRTLRWVHHD
jgi:hypothetical protein